MVELDKEPFLRDKRGQIIMLFFSCIAERARGIVGQHSDIGQDNFCPEGKNLLANVTNRAFPKLLRNRS